MLQWRHPKEMTDYDAAAALLMLSSGGVSSPQAESNNNYSKAMAVKPRPAKTRPVPAATAVIAASQASPPAAKVASRTQFSPRSPVKISAQPDSPIIEVDLTLSPEPKASPPSNVTRGTAQPKLAALRMDDLVRSRQRFGSSSPDLVHRWDNGRTSSPIVPGSSGLPSPHSTHEGYGELRESTTATVYDSPGMNGFALQLNCKGTRRSSYAVSSPEPLALAAPTMSERRSRRLLQPPPSSAGSNVEEKSLNSPTDSGVSSIHDEILQPNLNVQMWKKGSQLGEGLPTLVRVELRKLVDASSESKDLYTKMKMASFPLELSFNPNKSRFRKECANDIDNRDREKNNEASRRSRHKKKLMTHMMGIGLEFDRNENRQLYQQERWLTDMIFELEEKALNAGTDAQVLRKLRANCGFQ